MPVTQPASYRYWQLADLSRTVGDGLLVFECRRMNMPEDALPVDASSLRSDLARVIEAFRNLVRGDQGEQILYMGEREVLVPTSIAELVSAELGHARVAELLDQLAGSISAADILDDDEVELLDRIAKAADVEASASMRPMMRR
jgi:hypothetical protein